MILPSRSLTVTMSATLARSARQLASDIRKTPVPEALCLAASSALWGMPVPRVVLVTSGEFEGGDPAVRQRLLRRLCAGTNPHFAVGVGEVALDRRLGEVQRGGYLLVAHAARRLQQYL